MKAIVILIACTSWMPVASLAATMKRFETRLADNICANKAGGFLRTSENFFTSAFEVLSREGVSPELEKNKQFLRDSFASIFRRQGIPEPVITAFLQQLTAEDEAFPETSSTDFILEDHLGSALGTMRLSHGGLAIIGSLEPTAVALANHSLPWEPSYSKLRGKLSPYRLDLGHLATVPGPFRLAYALELLHAALDFLYGKNIFLWNSHLSKEWQVYAIADRLRSRLYQTVTFDVEFSPEQTGKPDRFVLRASLEGLAEKFYWPIEKSRQAFEPYHRVGDARLALTILDAALSKLPSNIRNLFTPAFLPRISAQLTLGLFKEAQKSAEDYLQIFPGDFEGNRHLLEAKVKQLFDYDRGGGNLDAAIALCDQSIVSDSLNLRNFAHYLKSRIFLQSRNWVLLNKEKRAYYDTLSDADYRDDTHDGIVIRHAIAKVYNFDAKTGDLEKALGILKDFEKSQLGINPILYQLEAELYRLANRTVEMNTALEVAKNLKTMERPTGKFL